MGSGGVSGLVRELGGVNGVVIKVVSIYRGQRAN